MFLSVSLSISFFDEVSNIYHRILTNQKQQLVMRNCQWNCIKPHFVCRSTPWFPLLNRNLKLKFQAVQNKCIHLCFGSYLRSHISATHLGFPRGTTVENKRYSAISFFKKRVWSSWSSNIISDDIMLKNWSYLLGYPKSLLE